MGRESVLGHTCTKYKLTLEAPGAGRETTAYVWWADALGVGLKSEVMGIVSECRNLSFGAQPASLFEVPAGYRKTDTPALGSMGMPKGMNPETMRKLQEAMRKQARER